MSLDVKKEKDKLLNKLAFLAVVDKCPGRLDKIEEVHKRINALERFEEHQAKEVK